jgi:hypothetical protein
MQMPAETLSTRGVVDRACRAPQQEALDIDIATGSGTDRERNAGCASTAAQLALLPPARFETGLPVRLERDVSRGTTADELLSPSPILRIWLTQPFTTFVDTELPKLS